MSALSDTLRKVCPAIFMAGFKDKSIKKRTQRELNKCAFFTGHSYFLMLSIVVGIDRIMMPWCRERSSLS